MEEHLTRIEARLASIERRLACLEGRTADPHAPLPLPGGEETATLAVPNVPVYDLARHVSLSPLVMAGAYLLRALTADGYWPAGWGVFAGLAYAALWLWLADRDAARGRGTSAAFHAACASLVIFPLLWESRVRLGATTDGSVALLWCVGVAAVFAVAYRARSAAILASLVLLAAPVGVLLVPATSAAATVSASLLVMALAARTVPWPATAGWLLWIPLLMVDGLALLLSFAATTPHVSEWLSAPRVAAAQWLVFLGTIALSARERSGGRTASAVSVLQDGLALVLVAMGVLLPWPETEARLAAAGLALAGATVAVRGGPTSAAGRAGLQALTLAAILVGSGLALSGSARLSFWGLLMLVTAMFAGHRATVHAAAVFGAALAWFAGLLPGASAVAWPATVLATVVLGVCAVALTAREETNGTRFVASTVLIVLALAGSSACMAAAARAALPPIAADIVRVPLPMVAALALAGIHRALAARQVWVAAVAAMAGVGLKVLVVDVLAGSPPHQFAGLATLGVALLGATRWLPPRVESRP
jgi:hypothetical protein